MSLFSISHKNKKKKMFSSDPLRGIVRAILSGDSVIVKLVDNDKTPFQVVTLENLIAPKFGFVGKSGMSDEPFGYNSWEFLRNKCIGRRVLIYPQRNRQTQENQLTRSHPLFGPLPIIFGKIVDSDSKEDIGLLCCKEGWVKLRDMKSRQTTSSYYAELTKAQGQAQQNKAGIWSEKQGFVRNLHITPNTDNILTRKTITCNVDQIWNPTSFSVYVLPTHEYISISLTGVKPAKLPPELTKIAKDDTRDKFLHKEITIRISTYNERNSSFSACLLDQKLQYAVADSVHKGFAVYDIKTAEACSYTDLILQNELLAQKEKKGVWETTEPNVSPLTISQNTAGVISSIKGSNGLDLLIEGQRVTIYFNNIKIPRYNNVIGSDPLGFEAREYLRKNYISKYVAINVEGQVENRIYATFSFKGQSISSDLVSKGLAQICTPICGITSSHIDDITKAQEKAKAEKVGIWADELPPALNVTDLTNKKFLQQEFGTLQQKDYTCIIEHILSSTRYTVLIPELKWLIRVSLDGLLSLSPNDRIGLEAKNYLLVNLLQREFTMHIKSYDKFVCFVVDMTDKSPNMKNVSESILQLGYSEIIPKLLNSEKISQTLIDAQDYAKARKVGIWSDACRHLKELDRGTSYPVRVTSVYSPCEYNVQFELAAKEIPDMLKNATEPLTELPMINDSVVFRHKSGNYRVLVESINKEEEKARITMIDYQQDFDAPLADLYKLPEALHNIPAQAIKVTLSGLRPIQKSQNDSKRDSDYIWSIVKDAVLYLRVVSYDGAEPSVILLDKEDVDNAGCLGTALIQSNIVTYEPFDYPP